MTTISLDTVVRPSARLGPPSPLPAVDPLGEPVAIGPGVPDSIRARAAVGTPPSRLPYPSLDDYDRELVPAPHRVAVLDDGRLRATVALDRGGRVLSLVDLLHGRELLHANPVHQPANLALRNAWFSGGIEWNIGTRGHSPTTMDTLFSGVVEGPDGEPVLRLWEWERWRGVAFIVDLWLPRDAGVLAARVRIRNVNPSPTPMYWWTNAAVAVGPSTRVLAPASSAFRTEYPNHLRRGGVPFDLDGDPELDVSYPARHRTAADFFFDLDGVEQPWIAAVGGDGHGVLHTSTPRLAGRKLFVWGTGPGGRRWQEWLSPGGIEPYAEIQAGLAPTQFEHVEMEPGAEWTWTEVFAPITVDPAAAHSTTWSTAVGAVGNAVTRIADAGQLERWHADAGSVADRPPERIVSTGSGWGALERRRRAAAGAAWFDDRGTPFGDESLGSEQSPWLELLTTGRFPEADPHAVPVAPVTGDDWEHRLATAPATWATEYQLGVMRHGRGDADGARRHYERSVELADSAWARRGLARLGDLVTGRADPAGLTVASARAPWCWQLAAEAITALLDAGDALDALAFVDGLDPSVRRRGRVRMLEAWAALGAGQRERAAAILDAGLEVPDVREGERSLDALWLAVHPGTEIPEPYDFRMT